jgi:hypothetical protein
MAMVYTQVLLALRAIRTKPVLRAFKQKKLEFFDLCVQGRLYGGWENPTPTDVAITTASRKHHYGKDIRDIPDRHQNYNWSHLWVR